MSYSDSTIGLPELTRLELGQLAPARADPLGQPEAERARAPAR